MNDLIIDKETIYICDKGYIDYDKFDDYSSKGIYFISHLKDNSSIKEMEEISITYSDEENSFFQSQPPLCFTKTFA